MKKKYFLVYQLLIMGVFFLYAGCCKKDKDNIGNGNYTGNTFTDTRDGNKYKIIEIGNQVWMAENLKYLPFVWDPSHHSETDPYYYVYDYFGYDVNAAKATANYNTYGVLYNWSAAMAGETSSSANPSGVQGICPDGWHLPSNTEWEQLATYLGGESVAGGKLKETGTLHWASPNEGATNETGFTALPAGYKDAYDDFYMIGWLGAWWSTTEFETDHVWRYHTYYLTNSLETTITFKHLGLPVRCVRDN